MEAVMIERAFEFLFVLALVAPAAAVLLGVFVLAWPRRRVHGVEHTLRATSQA